MPNKMIFIPLFQHEKTIPWIIVFIQNLVKLERSVQHTFRHVRSFWNGKNQQDKELEEELRWNLSQTEEQLAKQMRTTQLLICISLKVLETIKRKEIGCRMSCSWEMLQPELTESIIKAWIRNNLIYFLYTLQLLKGYTLLYRHYIILNDLHCQNLKGIS